MPTHLALEQTVFKQPHDLACWAREIIGVQLVNVLAVVT